MSAIGGILHLDGAAVDRTSLRRMQRALEDRGPDGTQAWRLGSIGLVRAHHWTVPEETGEAQPLPVEGGQFWIVSDARLDNRDDLIAELRDDLRSSRPSDAELIVASYVRWGEACPAHLVGDFAFAIWDVARRRLFCARDPIGVRLLHYAFTRSTFTFGSTIRSVLAALEHQPALNDALLRDLLAGQFDRWLNETTYRSIMRLPPSHLLVVSREGVRTRRYYVLGADADCARRRREADYVDEFRYLLRDAVKARLRSMQPVGLLVSGGLHSSSIACVTQDFVSSSQVQVPARIYSCVFDRTQGVDERNYFDEIAARCRLLPARRIEDENGGGLHEFASDTGYPLDEPEIAVDRALMLRTVLGPRRDGCRVVVSGSWRDEVLSGAPSPHGVGLSRLAAEVPHVAPLVGRPTWWLAAYTFLRSIMHATAWAKLRRTQRPAPVTPATDVPRLVHLPPGGESVERIYSQLSDGLRTARLVMHDNIGAHAGVEWRFPFLDRRLVEFVLALPNALRARNGSPKYILSQAMAGIVPENVRRRGDSTRFGDLNARGLRWQDREGIHELLVNPRIVRAGYMDSERLTDAWQSYWRDPRPSRYRHLVGALCVEAWLRHHERQMRNPIGRSGDLGDQERINGEIRRSGVG